ncbi:M23 family metallopeptidase [Muriicola sp. Z0-33]|uniref:M23 family metallopeptidase n=1 Tax=Muriicola sp. Z0-33 TaxID=2816957 RepID=UPI0022373155|nr:M23 family metallopeptidase [Muriicola sp. Z0-33]MCW5518136.1 M23 family metallopeptidase [Muriicola sp. Z0-33]
MTIKKSTIYISICACMLCLTGCEKDEVPSNYLDYQTIAELELPFNDAWFVVWGGDNLNDNHHASLVDQRFAIDVVQIENGSTFMGNGTQNEDYFCYGDPLYAPESGQIVEMENSVSENVPGETNTNQLFGNYVIIDHGNEEYSVLAHFMKNSINFNTGDFVTKGQLIGLTGNSGNSTEPHLHYHLQNKPSIGDGEGLPAQFRNYYANDTFISIGEPLKNQTIRTN